MFRDDIGFERITSDEVEGAIIGATVGALVGSIYIMVDDGAFLANEASVYNLQPSQPNKTPQSQSQNIGEVAEIIGGPALLGAVLCTSAISFARRFSYRKILQKEQKRFVKEMQGEMEISNLDALYSSPSFIPRGDKNS